MQAFLDKLDRQTLADALAASTLRFPDVTGPPKGGMDRSENTG